MTVAETPLGSRAKHERGLVHSWVIFIRISIDWVRLIRQE